MPDCVDMAGDSGDNEVLLGEEEVPNLVFKASYEAKLTELLHKINSVEIKVCSQGAKEFIKLLKDENGGKLLHLYVRTSPKFPELLEAWKLQKGKLGMSYLFSLVSAILSHPEGKYIPNDGARFGISRSLDKFAQLIVEEHLEDVYKELSNKEVKNQKAALLLLGSIVRRGLGLASELAKKFDFKLQGFSRLAEYKQKQTEKKRKYSTREAFVGFAMSFLEMGKPRLLRWVLQQREMYSGVLRGLGSDDDETVIFVLSTLRDRVLTEESLVPPGLRSVLFGSVTLEQLASISSSENGGPAAELAYNVLVLACTDPSNGLMIDLKRRPNPLRGNPTRLLGVMKKLKATEIDYHRELLLAIVQGRPTLGSIYLNEFPYNLEDHTSPNWFSIVSLTANLVSSVSMCCPFDFLESRSHLPSFESVDVQSVMNCICPRPLSRSVINKGLLHSDTLVKHGTLRLLLEALKLLDSFINSLNMISCSTNEMKQSWKSLKKEIQDEARTLLPDFQVLLTQLSSLSGNNKTTTKRKTELRNVLEHNNKNTKKAKKDVPNEETDIIVGGISSAPENYFPIDVEMDEDVLNGDELDSEKEFLNVISEIWVSDQYSKPVASVKDAEICFHSKLLDALKLYLRTIHNVLEGSFDFFMNIASNLIALESDLQRSLLSLLNEFIGWSSNRRVPLRTPPIMYKHLQPFVSLLILSPISDIKDLAYDLARAAMLSSGAFDRSIHEVGAWFLFLPGYGRSKSLVEAPGVRGVKVSQSLSQVVISFLCDAVSTVGNSLFKYWDIVRHHTSQFTGGVSPDFSPLIVCVLQKCVRLLSSESEAFSLAQKSMISLYVCSTLKYLLQNQVDPRLLSTLIQSILSEGIENNCLVASGSTNISFGWRSLNTLLLFSRSVIHYKTRDLLSSDSKAMAADKTFTSELGKVKQLVRSEGGGRMSEAIEDFSSALLCATPDGILQNFPPVLTMSRALFGASVHLLSSICFLEPNFLVHLSDLWPAVFSPGLNMALSMIHERREEDASEVPAHSLLAEEMVYEIDFDATESAVSAFGFFLKHAPFHVLFPSILSNDISCSVEPSRITDLLLTKISECASDGLIVCMRLILFWFSQISTSQRDQHLDEHNQFTEICLALLKHVFSRMLVLQKCPADSTFISSTEHMQEVAMVVFSHPVVKASLDCPFDCDTDFKVENYTGTFETFLTLCRERIHIVDQHVLDLLTTTCDYLLSSVAGVEDGEEKPLMEVFNVLVHRLLLEFRNKFDLCVETKCLTHILPAFCAVHALIRFISPFEPLELVRWMFSKVDVNDLAVQKSGKISAISVGLCIACGAFETLSMFLHHSGSKRASYDLFWEIKGKGFDADLIESIYIDICNFAIKFDLMFADISLLKAVGAVHRLETFKHHDLHPLSLIMSRAIMRTPSQIILYCTSHICISRVKLLFFLTEMNPMLQSFFGHWLLSILNRGSLLEGDVIDATTAFALADEEFLMLLPAALSYLNSALVKYEQKHHTHFTKITSFYSKFLLKGFLNWSSFVSSNVFEEEYNDINTSSTEEVLDLAYGSFLGKTISMLQFHFALIGDALKLDKRLTLFDSIFPSVAANNELLDRDVKKIQFGPLNKSLNVINRAVAKVSISKMLLFPEDKLTTHSNETDKNLKENSLEAGSTKEALSRMRFMNILVSTWQRIVRKLPLVTNYLWLYKCLEDFLLRTILEIATKMQDSLVQLESIPFLEQLMRSSLQYRFEDPITLKLLRCILTLMSEGKFSRVPFLQWMLGHSQFASTICPVLKSSNPATDPFFKPMSSILRSLVVTYHSNPNALDGGNDLVKAQGLSIRQLEVVKLLRVLLQTKPSQFCLDSGKNIDINLKELHLMLLSLYGATLDRTDMEIYKLMDVIQHIDESQSTNNVDTDYLWGMTTLKLRKEWTLEQGGSSLVIDTESDVERRRSRFRENLQIDPKTCASTILYYPYDRTVTNDSTSSIKLQVDDKKDSYKTPSPDLETIQRYDPVFILRFSIHSLSVGYIEPVEFVGLGLLAVAFVSMSSADVGMRKLAYETLGKFKKALENCQKNKDVTWLRLLLTYVQNGVHEPWQRIPSVIALFAAEASLVLLDRSHDQYTTLSNLLMHSSRINLKEIPLFQDFFWSSSVNFKTERLWILRLAYAGLNTDDDAHIYIRNSLVEMLMSFYSSPLTDNESKELILQIVRKSVKLQKMARYLVERCGLLSWFSSILSAANAMLLEDETSFSLAQLIVILEAVNEVLSSRNVAEWLKIYALEQLMELSTHLYGLLVGGHTLIKKNVVLLDSILQIIISTLKISQQRKIYQPHFTLSLEGLVHIHQLFTVNDTARSDEIAELGLRAILVATPPVEIFNMDQQKLSSFLLWGTSTALMSYSREMFQQRNYDTDFKMVSEEASFEESLLSKFLRWLTASVVLGKIYCKDIDLKSKLLRNSNPETLQSLLAFVEEGSQESNERTDSKEILAGVIYYLQQLLGMRCKYLPSVASALGLLLFCETSTFAGMDDTVGAKTSIQSLCSRVQFPPEVSPSWRWSFYQPWKAEVSSERSDVEKIDELHACQTLLLIFADLIGKKTIDSNISRHEEQQESCGVFKWERSLVEAE